MRLAIICTILIQLSIVCTISDGETFDPEARAKAITPFVEQDTALVACVAPSRLDVKAAFDLLERILPPVHQKQLKNCEKQLTESLAAVARTGVDEFYLVAPFSGLLPPQRMLMVTPISGESQEKSFRQALQLNEREAWTIHGAVMTQFPKPALEHLRHPSKYMADQRPELAAAFRAAGDSAVQVLFLPPRATRRVIDELYPELPEQLGGGPSSTLTRGVRWAAVGIDIAPNPSLKPVIQSDDAKAAEALNEKLPTLIRLAAESKQVKEVMPWFEKIIPHLKLKQENDQLILRLEKLDALIN